MDHGVERCRIFADLKATIERILSQHSTNILYVHGGLTSLVASLDQIFQHGIKQSMRDELHCNYWTFICNLQWLDPSFASTIDQITKETKATLSESNTNQPQRKLLKSCGLRWLENSLRSGNLAVQLKPLLGTSSPMHMYYDDWAFLMDDNFRSALLICVNALEQNSAVALAKIPVSLFASSLKLSADSAESTGHARIHRSTLGNGSDLSNPALLRTTPTFCNANSQEQGASVLVSSSLPCPSTTAHSPQFDPLCGKIKAESVQFAKASLLSGSNSTSTDVSNPRRALSYSFTDRVDNGSDESMGNITSLSTCINVCSPFGDEIDDMQSESLYDQKVQQAVKPIYSEPLFDDSDNSDFGGDDLSLLLASRNLPDSFERCHNVISHMYSTVGSSTSPVCASPVQNATILDAAETNSRKVVPLAATNNHLPDLVISAEESIIGRASIKQSISNHTAPATLLEDPPVYPSCNAGDSSRIFAHRRSRSDHYDRLLSERDNSVHDRSFNAALHCSNSLPSLSEIDGAINSTLPGYSPEAMTQSQSLMKFLKNQDLSTCADIDKENAHFYFSEMLIAAIEQVKSQMKLAQHAMDDSLCSTDLQQPIACHNIEPDDESFPSSISCLTDTGSDVTLTSPSNPDLSSASSSYASLFGSYTSEPRLSLSTSTSDLTISSMMSRDAADSSATLTNSEVFDVKSTSLDKFPKTESLRTAESIAIGLLQTFSGQRHVTAGEIDWLISEEDVPQKLLPLPRSIAVDPDPMDPPSGSSSGTVDQNVRIRGNQDWAPPRPQLIFYPPTKLKLKKAMVKQNYRCAGCGTLVDKAFIKRFRVCEYLGKYFCTCCHDNKMSIIPAHVLQKFDFTRCKVSNFSFDLLERIDKDPLFNIDDINPSLYKKVKTLAAIRDLRVQLSSLHKYLQSCRFANAATHDDNEDEVDETSPLTESLLARVASNYPPHMLDYDPHTYSLYDLRMCKTGQLLPDLRKSVDLASQHLEDCQLCRMKGFICEFCNVGTDIIFPHQRHTSSCPKCHACYHTKCYIPDQCLKCARILKRKQLLKRTKN